MARRRLFGMAWLAAVALSAGGLAMPGAAAAVIDVSPGDGLQAAILAAGPGDTLRLAAGLHRGAVRIDRPLTLEGAPGAVVDAGGKGQVIRVSAPDVTVRGLVVHGSGTSLADMDAGIFLDKAALRALVEDNLVEGDLIGIDAWGSKDAVIRNNRVA